MEKRKTSIEDSVFPNFHAGGSLNGKTENGVRRSLALRSLHLMARWGRQGKSWMPRVPEIRATSHPLTTRCPMLSNKPTLAAPGQQRPAYKTAAPDRA